MATTQTLYESEAFIYNRVPIKIFNHHYEREAIYTPLHWHRNVEFNLTTNGRIRRSVDGCLSDQYPGSWNVVNSGELHSDRWVDQNDIFEGITLQISRSFLEYWLGEEARLKVPESDQAKEEIAAQFYRFGALQQRAGDARIYGIEEMEQVFHFLYLLKIYCIDEAQPQKKRREKALSGIKQIINYIDQHYADPITLGSVAEEYHYTSAHLSRLFKEHIGQNFHEYLQNVRLLNSVNMIKAQPDIKLTECALQNGFPNIKSFIEAFKKFYGCTPSTWFKTRQPGLNDEKKRII